MLTGYLERAEARRAIAAGGVALGAIALFVFCSVAALAGFGSASAAAGVLSDAYVWRVLRFTLLQASLSTFLSVLLAVPLARALARRPRFAGRIWIIRLMAVPLGLPVLIGALGLIGVFGRQGLVNDLAAALGFGRPLTIYGLFGILVAHVYFNMPLAARLLLSGLERIPPEYFKQAAMLSMPGRSVFRFIEWPVIRPLIPGAAGLVFMLCATSFTLVLVLGGGPAATTIEVAIYQALSFDFNPARAVTLSGMQILLTGIVLAGLALFPRAGDPGVTAGAGIARPDAVGGAGRIADGLAISTGGLFLALPLAVIAARGLDADLLRILREPVFLTALATSLSIAMTAAFAATLAALAFLMLSDARSDSAAPSSGIRFLDNASHAAASLVLLVPPVVLGTGWFLLLHPLGITNIAAPLVVVAINALMALPFVLRVLGPAWRVHRARTARLAASLGLSGFARMRLVDAPGLARAFSTAFAFAMALSLGDLGAVALFGDSLTTLPFLLYSRMGSYRTADAAGLALILGLLCLVLMVIGTRKTETEP